MKKLIILFIFVLFQSNACWSQIEKKILGKWEVTNYDVSEENDGDQERPTGIIWTFNADNTCEERSDPSNPNDVTIYEYKISQNNCETGVVSAEFYYINLINKTLSGDDYCFMIDIDKIDETNQEVLSLYEAGAIQPNILIRK